MSNVQVKEFGIDKESGLVATIMFLHTFIQWINPKSKVFFKWKSAAKDSRKSWGITLGDTIWIPNGFIGTVNELYGPAFFVHELEHVDQWRRGAGVNWLRTAWYWIKYLLLPLPIFITLRAKYEKIAYGREIQYLRSKGLNKAAMFKWVEDVSIVFTSGSYFYMDPFDLSDFKSHFLLTISAPGVREDFRPPNAALAEELYYDQAAKFASRNSPPHCSL